MPLLQPHELVFYKEDGKIMSAGYAINNIFAENGISPGAGAPVQGGGGKRGRQGGTIPTYVIPTALLLLQQGVSPEYFAKKGESVEVIGDGLYDKLLSLAGRKQKGAPKFGTRRRLRPRRNKTRKRTRR